MVGWRILERFSADLYLISRTQNSHVRYAPLYIHRFPLCAPRKLLEATSLNRQYQRYEQIQTVPDRLRWLRHSRGLMQREVAVIAGVSRSVYIDLETGAAKQMPAGVADKLAHFYGVPVAELLDDYSRFLLNDPTAQLRQRRMESSLTREGFAQQLGTSLSNLERWETGKCTISYKCWERFFAERK